MYVSFLSTAEKNTLTRFVLVRKTSSGSVWALTTLPSEENDDYRKKHL